MYMYACVRINVYIYPYKNIVRTLRKTKCKTRTTKQQNIEAGKHKYK